MIGASRVKTLGDIRTALGIRLRSKPAQQEDSYRDVYLLGIEKLRMRGEMRRLERQRGRVEKRLAEIRSKLERLAQMAQEDAEHEAPSHPTPPGKPSADAGQPDRRPWKRMPIQY
ncbi:MAG: hypothetical protein HY676_06080 [Chloroflexi bacterium]|nr:hypothetical protein [Chloroflexota bacterium]